MATRRGGAFPFTVIGLLPFLTRKPLWLMDLAYQTFPFMAENGKVKVYPESAAAGLADAEIPVGEEGAQACVEVGAFGVPDDRSQHLLASLLAGRGCPVQNSRQILPK